MTDIISPRSTCVPILASKRTVTLTPSLITDPGFVFRLLGRHGQYLSTSRPITAESEDLYIENLFTFSPVGIKLFHPLVRTKE
jgi:hypothetical protein